MNSCTLLLCVAAAATAVVGQYANYVPVSSQYHMQDKYGGFSHGSSTGMQSGQSAAPGLYGYAGAAAAGHSAVPQPADAPDASPYRTQEKHGYAYGPSRGPSAQYEPFAAHGASSGGYPYSYGTQRAEASDVRTPAGTANLFYPERDFGRYPYPSGPYENAAVTSQAASVSRSRSHMQDKYAYEQSGGRFYNKRESGRYPYPPASGYAAPGPYGYADAGHSAEPQSAAAVMPGPGQYSVQVKHGYGPSRGLSPAEYEPRDRVYSRRETGQYPYPSQYHRQDNHGQYEYGYTDGHGSSKTESRQSDGTTKGSYSYPDGHGSTHDTYYTADANGFRTAGTDIPVHHV